MASERVDDTFFVIGAGCMRTGTLSTKIALEILGKAKCYHMGEAMQWNRHHFKIWYSSAVNRRLSNEDARFMLRDYRSCTDIPTAFFYKDLMRTYPNAKVLLTVRDPKKWVASYRNTVFQLVTLMDTYPGRFLRYLVGMQYFILAFREIFYMGLGIPWDTDEDVLAKKFVEYNEKVKREVPADRLLVFEVAQGWKPLCDFLGLPIPDQPFPNLNDTPRALKIVRVGKAVYYLSYTSLVCATAAGAFFLYKKFFHRA